MSKVVTANTLDTGTVVFLDPNGQWVSAVDQARHFADAEAADQGLNAAKADAARAIVVEPFLTEAGPEQDGRPKMTLRDTIRAFGPTIDYLPSGAKGA